MSVYRLSIWIVKKGQEEEVAALWRKMAGWTMKEASGVGSVGYAPCATATNPNAS